MPRHFASVPGGSGVDLVGWVQPTECHALSAVGYTYPTRVRPELRKRSLLAPIAAGVIMAACCTATTPKPVRAQEPASQRTAQAKDESAKSDDPTAPARNRMVQRHLAERGIKNPRVLEAFRTVPRHRFLPPESRRLAYDDESIPIGEGQTITPPYDVAYMTELLNPKPEYRVYEVGTGSGYQSAILSRIVKEVYSVEIHAPLSKRATAVHKELGYNNIHTRIGDGYEGWPEAAPFDAIIVTCAPEKVPQPLVDQLKEGGRLVIPIGSRFDQTVYMGDKHDGKVKLKAVKPTLFVPMTGRAQREAAAARKAKADQATEKP
jgi:protein-L-isoaspartate(D-aspartate) O-methyltransferase